MKAVEYKLKKNNAQDRQYQTAVLMRDVSKLEQDKNFEIVLRNYSDTKSDRQRRTNWLWNNQVAKSGIGSNDSADGVHLNAKWQFARPLLLAGNDDYSLWVQDLIKMLEEFHPNDNERLKNLFVHGVHTEKMLPDMVSDFLNNFQNYWTQKGVKLTDPSLKQPIKVVA